MNVWNLVQNLLNQLDLGSAAAAAPISSAAGISA